MTQNVGTRSRWYHQSISLFIDGSRVFGVPGVKPYKRGFFLWRAIHQIAVDWQLSLHYSLMQIFIHHKSVSVHCCRCAVIIIGSNG